MAESSSSQPPFATEPLGSIAFPSSTASAADTPATGQAQVSISADHLQQMLALLLSASSSRLRVPAPQPAAFATTPVSSAASEAIPPFVPPSTAVVASSGESLINRFPTIPRSVLLEVVRHEILPLNLYKLDIRAQERAADSRNVVDLEDGQFTIRKRSGAVKDYPSFSSLIDPLLIYFNVLGAHAASSNHAQAVLAILDACSAYVAHLSWLNRTYSWSAVVAYHKHYFLIRQREMARGIYSGWKTPDGGLVTEYLLAHSRTSAVSSQSSVVQCATTGPATLSLIQ